MIDPDYKEAVNNLEELIILGFDHEKNDQYKQILLNCLLERTNNGKLYKYRFFDDNGFSITNLEQGTLHCARPDEFNDPFDCRLGITYTSVAEAIIGRQTLDCMFSGITSFFQGKVVYEACGHEEQAIIDSLMDVPPLKKMIQRQELSASEKAIAYKGIIKEIVQFSLGNRLGLVPEGITEFIEKIDMQAIANMESCPTLSDLFLATGFVPGDKDEIGQMHDFASSILPGSKNKAPAADAWFTSVEDGLAKQIADTFLVGCLSEDPKQRLMWSHYSSKHKGFCVEYDLKGFLDKIPALFPVTYTTKRPLIPFDAVADSQRASDNTTKAKMIQALLTKDKCWEYEKEWRLIIPSSLGSEVQIPITCIFLGANIDAKNKEKILTIAEERRIQVKQMIIDRGEYELHAEDVLDI